MSTTRLDRPIFVIGCPRAGTTLVHQLLSAHREVWSLPSEAHAIFEGPFHPALTGYDSNEIAGSASFGEGAQVRKQFGDRAANISNFGSLSDRLEFDGSLGSRLGRRAAHAFGRHGRRPALIRFVEKTPKNCLRIDFLNALFPDAFFVYISRPAADNVDSLIRGWRSPERFGRRPRFARNGYPVANELDLADSETKWWRFALIPNWRELAGCSVAEVAAAQYLICTSRAVESLASVGRNRAVETSLSDLVADPSGAVARIFEFVELPSDQRVESLAKSMPKINAGGKAQTISGEAGCALETMEKALGLRAGRRLEPLDFDV